MGSGRSASPRAAGSGSHGGAWLLFAFVWASSLVALGTVCEWLGSLHAYGEHTHAQVALAVSLCVLTATWLAAEMSLLAVRMFSTSAQFVPVSSDLEPAPSKVGAASNAAASGQRDAKRTSSGPLGGVASPLRSTLEPLRACGELAGIVAVMYICDRTHILGTTQKVESKVYFWGLWALVMVVALWSVKKLDKAAPLQRDQTDEWKGWMQLMFVLYHYFKEEEVYNAIRVYIACYVFMTGYGNFFLYMKGKSFTIRRNLQMMFRLNFLGFIVCVALNNEYMLYYICAMHTLFTIFVIVVVYVAHSTNTSNMCIYAKIFLTLVGTAIIYDGPSIVFKALFGTLPGVRQLFAFHDPLHPEFTDELHEFHFRSGLDRFIWILGMLYAFHFPDFESYLNWVGQKKPLHRSVWDCTMLLACFAVMLAYGYFIFSQGKYDYNKVHPYTSWIPITIYMLVRNISVSLRTRYMSFFAYLGKYTLETYILQFHVWMRTTGINGSPKNLLVLVPDYYWLNFALLSAGYLFLSVRLCNLTVVLRDALIPETNSSIAARWAGLAVFGGACWVVSGAFLGADSFFASMF